jgi:hypothetical protein
MQKDFCNSIGQLWTHALQQSRDCFEIRCRHMRRRMPYVVPVYDGTARPGTSILAPRAGEQHEGQEVVPLMRGKAVRHASITR